MGSILLELTHWPVVVTTIIGELSEAELEPYLDDFVRLVIGRRLPFISIIDSTKIVGSISARVRQRVGAWQKENAAEGERYSLGVVIVTRSAVVRGAMTAINWIYRPRVPTVYEATLADGIRWAHARFAEAQVPLPGPASVRPPPSSSSSVRPPPPSSKPSSGPLSTPRPPIER